MRPETQVRFLLLAVIMSVLCVLLLGAGGCASNSQDRWPYKGSLKDNSGKVINDPKWNAIYRVR